MKRSFAALAALASTAALAGCYDEFANITVVNGTGAPVDVVVPAGGDGEASRPLPPGAESRRMFTTSVASNFEIRAAGCAYRYLFPFMGVNFPWSVTDAAGVSGPDYASHYPVRVQLDADMQLHLLPSKARGPLSTEQLRDAQSHGFPLRPVSRLCPSPL